MSFLLWQRAGERRIASPRLVMRAAEVPLLAQAQALRDALEGQHAEGEARIAAAAEAAREAGQSFGLEQGRQQAQQELAACVALLTQQAAQERERLRHEVGALALQVVRKLAGHIAPDELLFALADTAAREALPAPPVALVVHPDRVDAVRERMAHVAPEAGALQVEVRGDAAAAPGTCRLETPYGSVDASLDAQLARLEAAWQGAAR